MKWVWSIFLVRGTTYHCLWPERWSEDRIEGSANHTDLELRTTRKSVISAPVCTPTPKPAEPMALGADHAVTSQ
jgi:hypothetical protein